MMIGPFLSGLPCAPAAVNTAATLARVRTAARAVHLPGRLMLSSSWCLLCRTGRVSTVVTCQSTRSARDAFSARQSPELSVRDEAAPARPGPLDRLEEIGESLLGDVESELRDLDPDGVEPALLAEDDPSLGADELGRVRLDRRWIVELCGDGAGLTREQVVPRHGLPRRQRRLRQA